MAQGLKEIMKTYEGFIMVALSDLSDGDTQWDVAAGDTTFSEHSK